MKYKPSGLTDPFREGPLFYWRKRWRGRGSLEIEKGLLPAPPLNIVELDLEDFVAAERKRRLFKEILLGGEESEEIQDRCKHEPVEKLSATICAKCNIVLEHKPRLIIPVKVEKK